MEASCEGDGESIRVVRVRVHLYGKAVFCNPYEIEEWIGELLDCECLVVVG